jgi:hypothetical protein
MRGLAETIRLHAPPVRAILARAQSIVLAGETGRMAARVGANIHRLAPAARVLDLGLPLFGFPLDPDDRTCDDIALEPRRNVIFARTPLGRFAFVAGATVDDRWLT